MCVCVRVRARMRVCACVQVRARLKTSFMAALDTKHIWASSYHAAQQDSGEKLIIVENYLTSRGIHGVYILL